jgi:hypothetical protein
MFFSKLSSEERMLILKLRMLSDDDRKNIIKNIDATFENGD